MVTAHPPSSWSNPQTCADHAAAPSLPGAWGIATVPSSVPRSRACQQPRASPGARPALPAAPTLSPAEAQRLWAQEQWPGAPGRRAALTGAAVLAGTGTQALVWGRCAHPCPGEGDTVQGPSPAQPVYPCFSQAPLPPRAPHAPQLCYPWWEKSAAIKPGARVLPRVCLLPRHRTQVGGITLSSLWGGGPGGK